MITTLGLLLVMLVGGKVFSLLLTYVMLLLSN